MRAKKLDRSIFRDLNIYIPDFYWCAGWL